jgi:hypothetical protein
MRPRLARPPQVIGSRGYRVARKHHRALDESQPSALDDKQ